MSLMWSTIFRLIISLTFQSQQRLPASIWKMGTFSRFGLWRQVGLAVVLLVLVQAVASVATGLGLRSAHGWIWAYAAPLLGLLIGFVLLWWSQRPRRVGVVA